MNDKQYCLFYFSKAKRKIEVDQTSLELKGKFISFLLEYWNGNQPLRREIKFWQLKTSRNYHLQKNIQVLNVTSFNDVITQGKHSIWRIRLHIPDKRSAKNSSPPRRCQMNVKFIVISEEVNKSIHPRVILTFVVSTLLHHLNFVRILAIGVLQD